MGDAAAAVALASRVVLASALAYAAVAKLSTRVATAQVASVLPKRLAGPVARVLPVAELVIAAALVAWWTSAIPGVVAAATLSVFTVVLVRAQARRVPCSCFGARASARPVGASGIVRNGVLLALAVLATGPVDGARAAGVAVAVVALAVPTALAIATAR